MSKVEDRNDPRGSLPNRAFVEGLAPVYEATARQPLRLERMQVSAGVIQSSRGFPRSFG